MSTFRELGYLGHFSKDVVISMLMNESFGTYLVIPEVLEPGNLSRMGVGDKNHYVTKYLVYFKTPYHYETSEQVTTTIIDPVKPRQWRIMRKSVYPPPLTGDLIPFLKQIPSLLPSRKYYLDDGGRDLKRMEFPAYKPFRANLSRREGNYRYNSYAVQSNVDNTNRYRTFEPVRSTGNRMNTNGNRMNSNGPSSKSVRR